MLMVCYHQLLNFLNLDYTESETDLNEMTNLAKILVDDVLIISILGRKIVENLIFEGFSSGREKFWKKLLKFLK